MGAETRGDTATHGHGNEQGSDGIDRRELSSLGNERDETRPKLKVMRRPLHGGRLGWVYVHVRELGVQSEECHNRI